MLNVGGIQPFTAAGGEYRHVRVSTTYVARPAVVVRTLPPPVIVHTDVHYVPCARTFLFTIRTRSGCVETVAIRAPGLNKAIDKLRVNHPHATILSVN